MAGGFWSQSSSTTFGVAAARAKEDAREPTFADLYSFIESDYLANGQKSFRNVKGAWKAHLERSFGGHALRDYDPTLVQEYIRRRLADEAENATINREIAYLRRMANLGLQHLKLSDEKLRVSLMLWGRIKGLKERNVRQGYLKDSEYEALAQATAAEGLWLRTIFECACTYGWRKGELLNLRVGQVDLEARTISLAPDDTKNGQGRIVSMTQSVAELLALCVQGKRATEAVFTRPPEKCRPGVYRPVINFRKEWDRATEAASVPGLLFHDLRRTGVRNMRRRGIDDRTAMLIVGHRTHSMLYRYSIVNEDDLREAARKMEAWEENRKRLVELEKQQKLFEESAESTSLPKKRPN